MKREHFEEHTFLALRWVGGNNRWRYQESNILPPLKPNALRLGLALDSKCAPLPKRLGRSRQAEYAAAIRHSQSVYPAVLPSSSFLSYFLCGQTSRNRYTVLPSFLTIMILFGRPFMQRESDRKAGAKKKYRIVKIIMLNFLRPEQPLSPPQSSQRTRTS